MKKRTVSLLTAVLLLFSLLLTGCGQAKKDAQAFREALASVQSAEPAAELWSDDWSQTVASLRQSCEALTEDAQKALGSEALAEAKQYLADAESAIRSAKVSHEIRELDPDASGFADAFREIAGGTYAALNSEEQKAVKDSCAEYFDGLEKAEQASVLLDALAECPDAELEAGIAAAEAASADPSAARFLPVTDAIETAKTRLAAYRLDTEITALDEMTYEKLVAEKLPAAHEDLVRQARKDLDSAPDKVKALVKGTDTLHRQEVMLEAAALEIAIGKTDVQDETFVTAYEEAQTLYDAASDEAKALITNAAMLAEADEIYQRLQIYVILDQFGTLVVENLSASGFIGVDYTIDFDLGYATCVIFFCYPGMGTVYSLAAMDPSLMPQIELWEGSLRGMHLTFDDLLKGIFTEELGFIPQYDFVLYNADETSTDGDFLYLITCTGEASALNG